MNDDALPLGHELASSYLDNEVDAVERAQVEGSPELTELVATFRSVSTYVGDVAPASTTAREAALAAALAIFDAPAAIPAAAAVVAPVSTLAHRRARRTQWQRRFLSAAAAAAVIGVVGVAVVANNKGSDNKSSSEATRVAESPADAAPLDAANDAATATGEPVRPTIAVIGGAADVATMINSPAELLALMAAKTAVGPAPAASTTDEIGPTDDAYAQRAQQYGVQCVLGGLQWIADIIFIDTPAIAVVDPTTGRMQAIDANTCAVLAEVSP